MPTNINFDSEQVLRFMQISGQDLPETIVREAPPEDRALASRLILSEVLEYVLKGLNVKVFLPTGEEITDANSLVYEGNGAMCNPEQMIDGLADVLVTTFWNMYRFAVPLKEGYAEITDNNLTKFIHIDQMAELPFELKEGEIAREHWNLGEDIAWPEVTASVSITKVSVRPRPDANFNIDLFFAVGKDAGGKIIKPCHYESVSLDHLVA